MIQLQKLFKRTRKTTLDLQPTPNLQHVGLATEEELKKFAVKHGGGYYNCDCQEEADALTRTHVDFAKKLLKQYGSCVENNEVSVEREVYPFIISFGKSYTITHPNGGQYNFSVDNQGTIRVACVEGDSHALFYIPKDCVQYFIDGLLRLKQN
jgi:hypothetical protein